MSAARSIDEVLAEHRDRLMGVSGVVGTAIGRCDGVPCIRVLFADSASARRAALGVRLEGYVLQSEVSGVIRPRD